MYGNNQIIAFQEMLDTTNQNSIKEHLLQGAYTDDILVGSQESDTTMDMTDKIKLQEAKATIS